MIYWPFPGAKVSEWPGGYSGIRDGIHMGTDIEVRQGTPLPATADGTIRIYNGNGPGGWGIDIYTDDGITIRNWHMSRIDVSNGQRVNAGDIIGLTGGAKGTAGAGNSTGPHLHWELRTNRNFSQNGWLDPRDMEISDFGQKPEPVQIKDEEHMSVVVIANGEDAGHFAVFTDKYGWKDLDFGSIGGAQLRGYRKIAQAMNGEKPIQDIVMSGEEYVATRAHATGKYA